MQKKIIHLSNYGVNLECFEDGTEFSNVLVVLHGGPGDGIKLWLNNPCGIYKYHRIFYNQRGCNDSSIYKSYLEVPTIDDHVKDLFCLQNELEIASWTLLSHSYSAIIATRFAQKYPDRVSALLYVSPWFGTRSEYDYFLVKFNDPLYEAEFLQLKTFTEELAVKLGFSQELKTGYDVITMLAFLYCNTTGYSQLEVLAAYYIYMNSLCYAESSYESVNDFMQYVSKFTSKQKESLKNLFLCLEQQILALSKINNCCDLDVTKILKKLCTLPTAFVVHTNDPICQPSQAVKFSSQFKNSIILNSDAFGHYPFQEATIKKINQALDFLHAQTNPVTRRLTC